MEHLETRLPCENSDLFLALGSKNRCLYIAWIFTKFNPSSLWISNLSLEASCIAAHEAVLWGRFVHQRSTTLFCSFWHVRGSTFIVKPGMLSGLFKVSTTGLKLVRCAIHEKHNFSVRTVHIEIAFTLTKVLFLINYRR